MIYYNFVYSFVCLSNCLLSVVTTKMYYDRLFAVGIKNRPHVVQCLVSQLCSVFIAYPEKSVPFFQSGVIKDLLLYKEPKLDDHNSADITSFQHRLCKMKKNETNHNCSCGCGREFF
jgi:hypothetical protein